MDRFVGSFQARANPLTDLTLEYRLGYDSYRMETQQFIPHTAGVARRPGERSRPTAATG